MQAGDIVKIRQFGNQLWVLGTITHDTPDGARWRCIADGGVSHIAGVGDILPVACPHFFSGMTVTFHGTRAQVVGEQDGGFVRLAYARPKHELAEGGRVDFGPRTVNAARVHLIVENLGRFL